MKLILAAHCIYTVPSFAAALPPCHAAKGALSVTFSDPLNPAGVKPDAFALTVWSLKRSADYGSNHYGGHPLALTGTRLSADARTVTLDIPALAPTQCYELKENRSAPNGARIGRSLHGTIHQLTNP